MYFTIVFMNRRITALLFAVTYSVNAQQTITKTYTINGVSKWDAYGQYLNYHEGWGGYQRKSYLQKPWLVRTSKIVKQRSLRYAAQLKTCEEDFQHGWLWNLFFG